MKRAVFLSLIFLLFTSFMVSARPIADAGPSRYAATSPIQLFGSGFCDSNEPLWPLNYLTYRWQQVSGPALTITGEDTPTPTISEFSQTDQIQVCEFQLIVSDGCENSVPDTTEIIIVPSFTRVKIFLENASFNPQKPTLIHFSGGNGGRSSNCTWLYTNFWKERINIINFTNLYSEVGHDYTLYAHAIISYLSSVAPDYKQPIQCEGGSAGMLPAVIVSRLINLIYDDPRYAINRLTFIDGAAHYEPYLTYITEIIANPVDDEQLWIDNYVSCIAEPFYSPDCLNIYFDKIDDPNKDWQYKHELSWYWWRTSYDSPMSDFNDGVVAGWFWSVAGPGKNLQLNSTSGYSPYFFRWYGGFNSGYTDFQDINQYPGRLPQPVTLVDPAVLGTTEPNNAVYTCQMSKNAVGYQLLFGYDPHHIADYNIISDTPFPPDEPPQEFPNRPAWWTVMVYDQYGSTIYADPIALKPCNVTNLRTAISYGHIQAAIDNAENNDEIVAKKGIYYENINLKGKNITLRSTDPNDQDIVASTIINGNSNGSVVTFAHSENAGCVIAGFTITGGSGTNIYGYNYGGGIYCEGSSPVITNCVIKGNSSSYSGGGISCINAKPVIIDSVISNNSAPNGGGIFNCGGKIINCEITKNSAEFGGGLERCSCEIKNCKINQNYAFNGAAMDSCRGNFINSTFTDNYAADFGGVMYVCDCLPLVSCTITNNYAGRDGGGLFGCEGTITNCIIRNNYNCDLSDSILDVSYSNIKNGWPGKGNIDVDPCFVAPGYWDSNGTPEDANDDFWVDGDYHLLSQSACIDTGDPNYVAGPNETDLDGNPRVINDIIDMGAYEFFNTNTLPVANAGPNQTVYAWIDGLAGIALDGSGSYDDDGDELSYLWSWTIDSNTHEANGVDPNIELPAGEHVIELVVFDGTEYSEPNHTIITVIWPLESQLWIFPQIIIRHNNMRQIMAVLTLPRDITRGQIGEDLPLTLYPGGIEPMRQFIIGFGGARRRPIQIFAFYSKAELMEAVELNGMTELSAVGQLKTGRYFYASDTVRIINHPFRPMLKGIFSQSGL